MTDAKTTAKTIATAYIDLWNERAADRRRDIFKANWTSECKLRRSPDERRRP
jgi:hypothetical protein